MRLSFKAPKEKLSRKREEISPKPCLFYMISVKNIARATTAPFHQLRNCLIVTRTSRFSSSSKK